MEKYLSPESINSTKWYKQGLAIKPFYISYPWLSCFRFTQFSQPVKLYYRGIAGYFQGDYADVYFPEETMKNIVGYYWEKEEKNSQVSRQKKQWETVFASKAFRAFREKEGHHWQSLSDKELNRYFQNFSNLYESWWREAIFLDAFDCWGHNLYTQVLDESGARVSAEQEQVLSAPIRLSWLQKEKGSLLKIAQLAFGKPGTVRVIKKESDFNKFSEKSPKLARKLEQHAKQYHWIYNDYAEINSLAPQYFYSLLRKWLKEPRVIAKIKSELKEVLAAERKKVKLVKKLNLPKKLAKLFDFLTLLADWRDSRKAYNQMANAILKNFAQEYVRRSKLTLKEVEHLFWWEALKIFQAEDKLKSLAQKRIKGVFISDNPKKENKNFYGPKAKLLHRLLEKRVSEQNDLTGLSAYPGLVRGKVKLVRNQSEFSKMSKGDILVASNTRPEYVPIMKLAGAIVTEEGGITSHASIVSREMKKPCIVGMQGVMSKLKDGDLVQVDANKGIVKKINRS
jgi:phosphohistidine swiveling domain-containing protein